MVALNAPSMPALTSGMLYEIIGMVEPHSNRVANAT